MSENTTTTGTLTRRQTAAMEALLASSTIQEAATVAKLNPKTIYRYMKDPTFDAELRRRKRMMVDGAIITLQQNCRHAATALSQICQDQEAPAPSRVAAAKAILDSALKSVEFESLEERLNSIESRLNIN